MAFTLKYTLETWLKSVKPEQHLIVQASKEDGSDGITNTSIGMSWQYVKERGNAVACQIGQHDKLVLCAISKHTDGRRRRFGPINRQSIIDTLTKQGIQNIMLEPSEYFKSLPQYKFVISPEGNGIDCHRHYEALMAGCIPIVEDSELIRKKYGNVPFLYTRDYSEINESYLSQKYEEMLKTQWDFAKLYIGYWTETEKELIKYRGNYWCIKVAGEPWYLEKYMTTTTENGRLCNQIFRNLAVSLIAEKHNLSVKYCNYDRINSLGIELYSGKNVFSKTGILNDEKYFSILNGNNLQQNLNPNNNYFQTKEISNFIYKYLHSEKIKSSIIQKNNFNQRYNANNDLFIHVRLGDVANKNPGAKYYVNAIKMIEHDNIYISTDSPSHHIVKTLFETYPNAKLINWDEIDTIQFASTCKNVILSHGSFSAVIGYLAYFSKVYYPEYETDKIWYGDMFSIDGWIKCSLV
jgi:hypothetical protein